MNVCYAETEQNKANLYAFKSNDLLLWIEMKITTTTELKKKRKAATKQKTND